MALSEPSQGDPYLRTVTMTVVDWEAFDAAYRWLLGHMDLLVGCSLIRCFRAVEDPAKVCIMELWDSLESVRTSYERLGNVPYEFMSRAGNPEFGVDTFWIDAALPEFVPSTS